MKNAIPADFPVEPPDAVGGSISPATASGGLIRPITARGQILRPVGTIEAPDGYAGDWYTGTLAIDPAGLLWVHGTNDRGNPFMFPITDHYAAKHCTALGNASTVEARP